jgi:hypothetical protein
VVFPADTVRFVFIKHYVIFTQEKHFLFAGKVFLMGLKSKKAYEPNMLLCSAQEYDNTFQQHGAAYYH